MDEEDGVDARRGWVDDGPRGVGDVGVELTGASVVDVETASLDPEARPIDVDGKGLDMMGV